MTAGKPREGCAPKLRSSQGGLLGKPPTCYQPDIQEQ
jgi:hypothetical protein